MRRMWMLLLVVTLMVIVLAVPAMAIPADAEVGEDGSYYSCECAMAGRDENGYPCHVVNCPETKDVLWKPWDGTTVPTAHGNYYLTESFKMAGGQQKPDANATVRLDLNGFTVTANNNRVYNLENDGITLVITDSAGGGSLKSAKNYTQGGIIWYRSKANTVVTMYGGTIDGREYTANSASTRQNDGGIVEVTGTGIFTLNGGSILGCTEETLASGEYYPNCGPVYKSGTGTFTMNGGEIVGGKVGGSSGTKFNPLGGAVTVVGGTFTMNGGTIYGADVTDNTDADGATLAGMGGAVYVKSGCTFNLNGGTVQDGSATNGGNFYLNKDSSGVATLNIKGGTIQDGTATYGANIYIYRGTVNLDKHATNNTTGTVSGGTSAKNGGSIYISGNGALNMTDGLITGGTSTGNQGGNIFCGGSMSLTGGTVSKGTSEDEGGNISINSSKTVEISGVTITEGKSNAGNGNNLAYNLNINGAVSHSIGGGTQITAPNNTKGSNLYATTNTYNDKVPVITLSITNCVVSGGETNVRFNCTTLAEADTQPSITANISGDCTLGGYPALTGAGKDNITINWTGYALNNYQVIYDTLAEAIAAADEATDYVTLLSDSTDAVAVSADLNLDLNGHTVALDPASDDVTIKLFDSSAADYTVGTGKATGGSIENYMREFVTGSMTNYGHNYRFVTIQEDDGSFTAHRIYMTVKSIVLVPSYTDSNNVTAPAVMYRTVLRCDQTLADLLNDSTGACGLNFVYGTAAQSISYKDKVANFAIVPGADQDNTIRLGITNVLSKNNDTATNKAMGEAAFNNCSAYFTFTDGSGEACTVSSAIKTQGYSLKDLVEDAATKEASAFGSSLKTALGAMYTLWQTEFNDMEWAVSGLAQYAE